MILIDGLSKYLNFQNIFPVALRAREFTQNVTDVEYISATAEFAYQIYTIETVT